MLPEVSAGGLVLDGVTSAIGVTSHALSSARVVGIAIQESKKFLNTSQVLSGARDRLYKGVRVIGDLAPILPDAVVIAECRQHNQLQKQGDALAQSINGLGVWGTLKKPWKPLLLKQAANAFDGRCAQWEDEVKHISGSCLGDRLLQERLHQAIPSGGAQVNDAATSDASMSSEDTGPFADSHAPNSDSDPQILPTLIGSVSVALSAVNPWIEELSN